MKCTCPTQRPNARHPTPPIFHWEWGSRWLPNAKKSTHKKRNVHGRRKKLASPNAKDTNMLVFLALGEAKLLSGDAKVPDARYFAFWLNIGFRQMNGPDTIPYFIIQVGYIFGISNALQYSNMALETTALVMHDSNTCSRWYHFFLWLCKFHKHTLHIINIINIISNM